jgi:hypothetical protein
LIFI